MAVGDAVRRAKQRYYLETPRFDAYDEKSLMQWTLYGLPMYAVKTGIAAGDECPVRAVLWTGAGGVRADAAPRSVSEQVEVTRSANRGFVPASGRHAARVT